MADGAKVRVVRCPKCEKLLPELPDFSVYQCGGCGTVLRAKKKGILEEGLSNDLKGKGVIEIEKVTCNESETDRESNGDERGKTKERISSSSTPRVENRQVMVDSYGATRAGEEMLYSSVDYRQPLKGQVEKNWVGGNGRDVNMPSPGLMNSVSEDEFQRIRPQMGSSRLMPIQDKWNMETDWMMGSRGHARGFSEEKFANFHYRDEGPSNYDTGGYYGYGKHMRYRDGMDGLAKVENLENNRADLLRKLEELKDKISRSCDVSEKPKERVVGDRKMAPVPSDPYDANIRERFRQPRLVPGSPYYDHNYEHPPYVDRHGFGMQDPYASRGFPYEFAAYDNAYHPHAFKRPPHFTKHQSLQRSYHEHYPGLHMNFNHDPFVSYPHGAPFHHPDCSCLHCFNKNSQLPPKIQSPGCSGQRLPNELADPVIYHQVKPVAFGSQSYNSINFSSPYSGQLLRRKPDDLESEIGGSGRHRPRKVVAAHVSGQICYPIAGGAPFITCLSCFELLKLPRKFILVEKIQRKLKCGACSSTFVFELRNKGMIISVPPQIKQSSVEVDDESSAALNENLQNPHAMNSSSSDYNRPNYIFQVTDSETKLSPNEQKSNSSESEKRHDTHSSSSSFSESEQGPDCEIVKKDVTCSVELPLENNLSLHSDASLQEDGNVFINHTLDRFEDGNKSKRSNQDSLDKTISRKNSVKDASVATEMDVSFNEFQNTGLSQDGSDVSKEYRPRINKGNESFFVGILKKSFKDFSRPSQGVENGDSNVSINGHILSSRAINKAEKIAGPVEPGDYWYDSRAGFWGVMGYPCLGIIPPNIEEFNYPMPEDCAGGNTGVFVNGRELHLKDLELLASRGLPIIRHKYYRIDISGRVVDELTGEELDNLGKLAPTVERVKHGFGMKVPKPLAQQPR